MKNITQMYLDLVCSPPVTLVPLDYETRDKEREMNTLGLEPAREHLLAQLHDIHDGHKDKLREKFGLTELRPKTFNELKDFFAKGWFEYDGKDPDLEHISILNHIMFRDTSRKKDEKGFKAAKKDLADALTKTRDEIHIKSLDEALAAKRAFEQLH